MSTFVMYHHGISVLAISGEIDIASAAAIEQAIAAVMAEDPPSLIIDLLGVQFLGSVGVGVLVKARDKFADCDRFSVVSQGRITRRIIQLLDLDRVLSLQETVEEALSKAKARQAPLASPAPGHTSRRHAATTENERTPHSKAPRRDEGRGSDQARGENG